jgi:hypothetical protein
MAERSARRHRLLTVHAIVVQDVHRPVVAHLLHHAGVPANQPGLRASPDVLVHIISVQDWVSILGGPRGRSLHMGASVATKSPR